MWGYRMCNCNEEINKKCPNRVCAYCDWHLELQAKEQECEKLKTQILSLQTMEIEELKNYKQSLDEIEKYIKNQLDEFGNDVYNMDKSAINSIQSIINKAKEQK